MAQKRSHDGAPLLQIRDLRVEFRQKKQWREVVHGVSVDVHPREVVALVGESGSGKSTIAMSVPGLLPSNGRNSGSILLDGAELIGASRAGLRKIRGQQVAVIFQEPMRALNPVYTIGWQIREMLQAHRKITKEEARQRAIELLSLVDIPEPERRIDSYPHQLSGGQRQRAMIAQALALDPKVLIADEPTTALDVTVQGEILELLHDLKGRIDASILLITHDMGVVADMADRIVVLKDGSIVEQGDSEQIFYHPQAPYTKQLLNAVLSLSLEGEPAEAEPAEAPKPVFDMQHGVIEYPGTRGQKPFRAIDDVSITLGAGEVMGLVGESGSGKSTIGRAAVGLLPVVSGTLSVDGIELTTATPTQLREARKRVAMVFQDAGASVNPRWPIGQAIAEPLQLHTDLSPAERDARVGELLDQVQLSRSMRNRFPHQLSGGQRQRVGIARALALSPSLLIVDEPTSALDVSVQQKVLELFAELQDQLGFACLFITHDLAVVEHVANRIAVLRHGKLIETGTTGEVLLAPRDAYTKRLIAAVPVPDPREQAVRRRRRRELLGDAT
ncbi:MAG TPA: ABC transporter ATP-binding protein [Arachnia sp.]|nr:ABC transporter ATP-binding protein [Arachnia sp.]HMT86742.1 ABC transporter ATP-binding protein [Arachnia sp.]